MTWGARPQLGEDAQIGGEPGVSRLELRRILRPVDAGQMEDDVGLGRPAAQFGLAAVQVVARAAGRRRGDQVGRPGCGR